jgi:hypothetical protein
MIRYIGEAHLTNYVVHLRDYDTLREAIEDFATVDFLTAQDEILLFRCAAGESAGERFRRTLDTGLATHLLTRGPRGGVKVERL